MIETLANEPTLNTAWFLVIGLFWTGYLVLDGFDLGVGMLMGRIFARDEKERRLLLNTIGPVWDGNEVWLVTAGAATFAAFPFWYGALFSALYLPLTLLLLALILRAVSIEYRGKGSSARWARTWNGILAVSSGAIAFLIGAALALTTTGLPLDANGDRIGGAFAWLTWPAVLGGLGFLGFALVHGLAFLALKTSGPVQERAQRTLVRLLPVGLLPLAGWVLLVQVRDGVGPTWALTGLAVLGAVLSWAFARAGRDGASFAGSAVFLIAGAAAVFLAVFPVVLPTTLADGADLTVTSAASSQYTLKIMAIVGCFGLPVLFLYQGWSYWVFRKRLRTEHIPEAHDVRELAEHPTRTA